MNIGAGIEIIPTHYNLCGPSLLIKIKDKTFILCFCHHMPDRSIKFLGIENYLCARCLGICIGGILGLAGLITQFYIPLIFVILLLIPLILDGAIQALSNYISNNKKRIISGILFGVAIVYLGMYLKLFLVCCN